MIATIKISRLKHASPWIITAGVGIAILSGGGIYAALGGFGNASPPSGSIDLQKGLVGHWKLDGNGKDETPNSNNLTLNGPINATDRKAQTGRAMSFSNPSCSSRGLAAGNSLINNGAVTTSAWIYPTDANTTQDIMRAGNGADIHYSMYYDGTNQRLTFQWYDGAFKSAASTSATVPLNTWSHVAIARDSSNNLTFYRNGSQIGTASVTTPTVSPPNFYIGATSCGTGQQQFVGSIDDARVYNRSLSLNEISALTSSYESQLKSMSGQGGLLGQWDFNGNTKDSSPHANSGAITGGVTPSSDRRGEASRAYLFDGSSGYISVGNPSNLSGTMPAFSWGAWVNTANVTADQMFLSKQGANYFRIVSSKPFVSFYINGAQQTLDSGQVITGSTWYHLMATYDGSTMKIYINGSLANTKPGLSGTLNLSTGSGNFDIGHWTTADHRYFSGSLDGVRIYNKALSLSEIQQQYNSYDATIGLGGAGDINLSKGLVGHWPFNGNAKDTTPNTRTATLVNTPALVPDRKARTNSAYSFNGSNMYMSLGTNADYDYGEFSVSLWAKSDVANPVHVTNLAGKGNWNDLNKWYIGFKNGTYVSFAYGINWSAGPSHLLSNYDETQWHHYVGTASATEQKLYIDGVLVNTVTTAHGVVTNTYDLQIARSSYTGTHFDGSIDDIRIYNRALSAEEASSLYLNYQ